MIEWCIYYSDGSIFTSDMGIENAPVTHVQIVVQHDPVKGWLMLTDHPFFVWEARDGNLRWWCASPSGLENYVRKRGLKIYLIGEWIGDETFHAMNLFVTELVQITRKTGVPTFRPWSPDV